MVANTAAGETYSPKVAFVYIFNLVIGVGALALPIGFKAAGLILGIIFLIVIAFLAYMTVTWLIEVQASANALLSQKEKEEGIQVHSINNEEKQRLLGNDVNLDSQSSTSGVFDDESEMHQIFSIKRRVELGLMSEMFLGWFGQKFFYAAIIIYLYGDLAIYAVTVPTSLANVTEAITIGGKEISKDDVYYLYLSIFIVFIMPWTFFNFQKTKLLQVATLATRNVSLITMIVLGLMFIAQGNGAHVSQLPFFNFTGLPTLFGVSIYSFMCHHSLPSIITPISNKKNVNKLLLGDFGFVYVVYILLCSSALFAFGTIENESCSPKPGPPCRLQSLYIFNFESFSVRPIAIFLGLFPIFTLSANFPMIAITLRNNLMQLITYKHDTPHQSLRRFAFSLIACAPPFAIAYGTKDVDLLVNITGSYAGICIMFVIPALLVYYSRKKVHQKFSSKFVVQNQHSSPFVHNAWIVLILFVSVVSVGLITFNHIYKSVHKK